LVSFARTARNIESQFHRDVARLDDMIGDAIETRPAFLQMPRDTGHTTHRDLRRGAAICSIVMLSALLMSASAATIMRTQPPDMALLLVASGMGVPIAPALRDEACRASQISTPHVARITRADILSMLPPAAARQDGVMARLP
jgi:hypothetical protein